MISKTRSVFVQNGSILQRMQGSIWMNLKGFTADRETAENAGKSSDEKSQFVTFVLGGPGSGKGTQCVKIADVFGFTHLSAGDLLRKEISSNSEKGQMILDIIKEGKIVPSEVTVKLIQDAIRSSDSNKFLIDGFPRNEENRMAYESIIGMEPNLVLFFDCSTEEMIKRVLSRNQGRVDDNEETIKKRLKIFEDFNLPVINHYLKRGILHRISATGSEEDVFTRVRPIFEAYKALLSNRSNGSSTSTMELKISNFLQKCTFNQIKQIHAFIITTSLHQNVDVLSRFLRRSTEFGNMEYSDLVFSHILNGHFSNQVTLWNAMIRGYAFNGPFESGLLIYNEMQMRGLRPNNFTYPYVLHCCSRLRRFDLGKAVNCQVTKSGFSSAFKVSESLLNMFLNLCRSSDSSAERIAGLISARKLFDEMLVRPVDSWNKMISAYVEVNDVSCAQGLFEEMPERDIVSWNAMISGFIKSGDVAKARETFERMPDKNVVSWTSMVAAYGSSGNLSTAREFFDNMPNKNLVSWNTMISCYTQHKRFKEALSLFVHMQSKGVNPDGFTFSSALTACSQLGDLELGRWTRSQITDWSKLGLEVATAMIELYANCGHVDLAFALFLKAGKNKDVFCWNVMIKSLASHGRAEDAIKLFFLMIGREPLSPNEYTFSSVLFACSHSGLVTEGQRIFNTMETDFGVRPTVEHYGCMVDLLSRKGQLAEAFSLVEKMPFEPDVAIYGALLGGCRIWGDVKLAERVMKKMNGLKMSEPGIYVSLCNAYASMGEWPQASIARHVVEENFNYIGKKVGCSFVI